MRDKCEKHPLTQIVKENDMIYKAIYNFSKETCPFCQLSATQAELEYYKTAWACCGLEAQGVGHTWDNSQPNASLDDIKILKAELEEVNKDRQKFGQRYDAMVQMYEEQLYDARANDRCSFNYLSAIRYAVDPNADFPTLIELVSALKIERDELREELEHYRDIAMSEGAEKALAEYQSLRNECERLKEELKDQQKYVLHLERNRVIDCNSGGQR